MNRSSRMWAAATWSAATFTRCSQGKGKTSNCWRLHFQTGNGAFYYLAPVFPAPPRTMEGRFHARAIAFETQSGHRRKNNPSFPRKRESSGPKIGLIVLAKATSYLPGKDVQEARRPKPPQGGTTGQAARDGGALFPAFAGMTGPNESKCDSPGLHAPAPAVRGAVCK